MSLTPRRWLGSGLTAAVLAAGLAAGVVAAPAALAQSADPRVDALLHQRVTDPHIGTDVGMLVIDSATGALVSSVHADSLFLPASNMKIVTAVNALTVMGADAALTTRIRAGAAPNDIVLQGGGDPLLTTSDLQTMAKAATRTLSKAVPVPVHVDGDLLPEGDLGPGWPAGYVPSVASPVQALARLGDYSRTPSAKAAAVVVQRLKSLGFNAFLAPPAQADDSAAVLAQEHHTVGDAVAVMLSESENNVAEVLFRQVALATGGPATWQGGRRAAVATLRSLGIDASGMKLMDGSGLSRSDRVSPRFLTEVLRVARVTKPERYGVMFASDALPVSGRTGTLSTAYGRYTTPQSRCARGDVHAKTGSLFDVIALSGIAATTTGGERIFSILVNRFPQKYTELSGRQVLDGLTATITGCWD